MSRSRRPAARCVAAAGAGLSPRPARAADGADATTGPTSATPATASSSTCPCRRRSSTSSPSWPRTSTTATTPRSGDECVLRPGAGEVLRRRRAAPRQRLGRGRRRAPPGRSGRPPPPPGARCSTSASTTQGEPAHGRRLHVVPAHPARDRHAASRWPRRSAGRTSRSGFADILALSQDPDGLGRLRPPRVGRRSGSARPTPTSPPAACPP